MFDRVLSTLLITGLQELADQLRCPFFEASVKDNVNVDNAFEKLIVAICDNMRVTAESELTDNGDANVGTVVLSLTGLFYA